MAIQCMNARAAPHQQLQGMEVTRRASGTGEPVIKANNPRGETV